ncbi:MAG: BamA/TamA family outer membrane protein [Synergistetes bacterium]|nr:BamA/TamA family outer membrane protein [Synergistota bacterium]
MWRKPIIVVVLVALVFSVFGIALADEGREKITAIEVVGNHYVVKSRILAVIKLKVGDTFSPEKVKADVRSIYELGYFQRVEVSTQPYKDGVKVIYKVVENPKVKKVVIQGNISLSTADIKGVMFTQPGIIFNFRFLKHDIERILDLYRKNGYVFTKVKDAGFRNGMVKIVLMETKIQSIIIQGNRKTKSFVIRRELLVHPGEVFNAKKLRVSLKRLRGLDYFSDVSVGFEPTKKLDEITVVITVKEKKTGRIGFGIGYGTVSGWSGGMSYEERNFRGLGQKLSVGFEVGGKRGYYLHFEDPYMDETHWGFKLGIYKKTYEDLHYYKEGESDPYSVYDETKEGFYVGAGRKFGRWITGYLILGVEDVDITPHEGYPPPPSDVGLTGKNATVTLSVKRDTLNPLDEELKGDIEKFTVQKAGSFLGGEYDYTKYVLEFIYYTPLELKGLGIELGNPQIGAPTFAVRLKGGKSSGDLPYFEQFTVGGPDTLRGYDEEYFRGNKMFVANVEVRFYVEKNIELVIFHDWGRAWKEDESFDLGNLAKSYGIGFRVKTPIGFIRLDFGHGDQGENHTYISFGETF